MKASRVALCLIACVVSTSSLFAMKAIDSASDKIINKGLRIGKKTKPRSTLETLGELLLKYQTKRHAPLSEIDAGLKNCCDEKDTLRAMYGLIRELLKLVDLPKLCRIAKIYKINFDVASVKRCSSDYSACSELGVAGVIFLILAGAQVAGLRLLDDAVFWGDRWSVLSLLLGGVTPNTCLKGRKACSLLRCAVLNLCHEDVVAQSTVFADRLAIVCMLLQAGATFIDGSCVVEANKGTLATCYALKEFMDGWRTANCEVRLLLIQRVLQSSDQRDCEQSARDIIMMCRLLENLNNMDEKAKSDCLLNLYDAKPWIKDTN